MISKSQLSAGCLCNEVQYASSSVMEPNQFITHVGRVRSSTCTYTLPGLRNKDHEGIIAGQNFFPRGGDSTS